MAFPPFIDSLDDDQKREVRRAFSERAFKGRPTEVHRSRLFRKEDSFGLGLPEVIAAVLAAVKQADKETKPGA